MYRPVYMHKAELGVDFSSADTQAGSANFSLGLPPGREAEPATFSQIRNIRSRADAAIEARGHVCLRSSAPRLPHSVVDGKRDALSHVSDRRVF